MTNEEIELKASELSAKHGAYVLPIVLEDKDDNGVVIGTIIGFIKEPPLFMKMKILDKAMESPITAASSIVDAYLIKEESDPRMYNQERGNDQYYIGATMAAYTFIKVAANAFKKK